MANESDGTLVLLAHPDDEFALFSWLLRWTQDGSRVTCVWLTDGGWGGQDVAVREAESVAVLGRCGVVRDRLDFAGARLGIPDGRLHSSLGDACSYLVQRYPSVSRVVVPAWEGGHQDHDATHLAGHWLARGRLVRRMFQFPLYQGRGLPGPMFRVMTPLVENGPVIAIRSGLRDRLRYPAWCLQYRSQWRSFAGLLPFYAIRMLASRAFSLQRCNWNRTGSRPHSGPLLYERRGGPTWEEFARETSRYRSPAGARPN